MEQHRTEDTVAQNDARMPNHTASRINERKGLAAACAGQHWKRYNTSKAT
ncbi:hypothetical protein GSbR_22790 [Geobacter sp. SVR]|nr:hypothetical protein GSVR_21200 [Geobacter sp. SVR]GCF85679.1 hypothetical protein GSbR_22790 [Geobacter sp. SVR]